MSLPGYPSYKETGVEWLGRVPEQWEIKRLKHLARLLTEKSDRRTNPVALENIEGWSGKLVATESEFAGEGVAFDAGDILFGKLRPYLAKALLADTPGEAVGDFHVMRPAGGTDGRYLQLQMLTRAFISVVDGSTFGAKMPRVGWDFMGNLPMAAPPSPEQKAIAAFLDRETGKIDALVQEQRRLIELLKEKRQAVISHAVTKGLHPDAPMKPSGIEWLGDVPEHWKFFPIKYLLRSLEQGWSPQCESSPAEEGQWGVLKVGCVNGGLFRPEENKALPDDLSPIPELSVRRGDLLISRANTRELVGSAAAAPEDFPNLMVCDKLYRLRCEPEWALPQYLAHFLSTPLARQTIEIEATGASASMLNIGQGTIKELRVPVPPLEEQREINSLVEGQSSSFNGLIAEAERAILLLTERRSALISAAVTGKIDVRGMVTAETEAA